MKKLKDPAIYKYSFWIRWQNHNYGAEKKDNWEIINNSFGQAWNWIHDKVGANPPAMDIQPWKYMNRIESKRLAGTNWLSQNDFRYLYEARALLDSVYLQMGISFLGDGEKKLIPVLQNKLINYYEENSSEVERARLGEVTCFYAEVNKNENVNEIARKCFEEICPGHSKEIITFKFFWGSISLPSANSNFFVILSDKIKNNIIQSSHFLNFILPRLMLAFIKSKLEFDDYENSIRNLAELSERKMCQKLKGREKKGSLTYLENRTLELSKNQDELVENLAKVKQKIITIKTNIRNIELVLSDSSIIENQKLLFERFGEPWQFAVEQMDLDLSYFESRIEEANLALQTMRTFVDIERGKMDRIIVIVLSVVGGMIAIGDTLSEIPFKFRLVMVSIAVLFALIMFFTRSKKKNNKSE